MQTHYTDTGGNVREEIQAPEFHQSRIRSDWQGTFHFLPHKANPRKEKRTYEQNSRHGTDNRRAPHRC
jgi:hypothetical protein